MCSSDLQSRYREIITLSTDTETSVPDVQRVSENIDREIARVASEYKSRVTLKKRLSHAFTQSRGTLEKWIDKIKEAHKDFLAWLKTFGVTSIPLRLISLAKVILPLLVMALGLVGVKTGIGKFINRYVKTTAESIKNTKTIYSSFDELSTFAETSINSLSGIEKDEYKEIVERIVTCTKRSEELHEKLKQNGAVMLTSEQDVERIKAEHETLLNINHDLALAKDNKPQIQNSLRSCTLAVNSLTAEFDKIRLASQFRQEPVCLWLYGKPGVGKSKFAGYLLTLLAQLEGILS